MSGFAADQGVRLPRSILAVVAMLFLLAVPLYFVDLGGAGLVDPDEPYYAVPALEMLKTGTWAVPVFRGQAWFDKPVLFYWMILAAFKAFGVSEWAARIGSALAGFAGAVAMATLSPPSWRKSGVGVLAALVLATSLEYALLSRSAVTDMTLTLFVTLGFLAVARFLENGGWRPAAAAGAAFGLATLTKGPVGAIVPGLALIAYGLATRRRELLSPLSLLASSFAFVVTAAPWYVYMLVAHRDLVLKVFLGDENFGRFVSPEHQQIPFFYVVVLGAGLVPWSAALPAGILRALRAWWRGDERCGQPPGSVFALAWFVSVVGLFSLSASKLLTYILPAFPAAALLIADYWRTALAFRGDRDVATGPKIVAWSGAAISLLMATAIVVLAQEGRFRGGGSALYALAAVLTAAGIAAVTVVRRGKLALFAGVQAATTIALVLVLIVYAWPGIEASESTRTLVGKLQEGGLADQVDGAYRVPDVSLEFYLGRALHREDDAVALARRIEGDPGRLWVVRTDEIDALAERASCRVERVLTVSRRSVVRLVPSAPGDAVKAGS